ncbi:MAG: HAD family hydrolase [Actinomycetota bacterium]|nr:HAD family hydrolase [Actinomycetota bacterium]
MPAAGPSDPTPSTDPASEAAALQAVLFDLDGTLVDTSYVHTVCWWQALLQFDRVLPMARIHRAVGLGSDKILDHLLGDNRTDDERADDDDIIAAHATLFTVWYDRARPLPGAADLLHWCANAGLAVVMATSGSSTDLEALMATLDADDAVTASTTSADAAHSKPDTDLLEVALERVGAEAGAAVFVGDAVWDMLAARRMGMRCIGLECGGTSEAELREAGADEVWKDPADLLAHVEDSALTQR